MGRSVRRDIQIIVIDDNSCRDLNSVRPVWKKEDVTLLGPFTSDRYLRTFSDDQMAH